MFNIKVTVSEISLGLLPEAVLHVNLLKPELSYSGEEKKCWRACILDEMVHMQTPCNVPALGMETAYASIQPGGLSVVKDALILIKKIESCREMVDREVLCRLTMIILRRKSSKASSF